MIKGRAPGQTEQVWVGSWPEARRTHPCPLKLLIWLKGSPGGSISARAKNAVWPWSASRLEHSSMPMWFMPIRSGASDATLAVLRT
jgi:hypothetical protein